MSANFKTVAQNNDLEGFYTLWKQSNSSMSQQEALRWACAFDRHEMIDCVLDSNTLNTTDLTSAFKEATARKSLNAIGKLLRWCRWNNRFEQERIGTPSSKYINEIAYTALMSDWSAVFVAHRECFQILSFNDRSQLYLRGIREGAVECLHIIDNGQCIFAWPSAFKTAMASFQSKSLTYLMRNASPLDQKNCHSEAVNGLAGILAGSHLFMHPQALECAIVLLEFVSPQDVRRVYRQFSQPDLSGVLDKVASMYEKKLLDRTVQEAVEQKDAQTTKRKI